MIFVFFTAVTNEYIYGQTYNGPMVDESDYKKSAVSEVIELNEFDSYPSFSWEHVPLELCDTLQPKSWGYHRNDDGDHKSADQVMEMLNNAKSIQANLLLNTGPLPDGSIYPGDVRTLKEVGKRLRKVNT